MTNNMRIHDRRVHEAIKLEHLRIARLAVMNQVQDVATVFVPRCRLKLMRLSMSSPTTPHRGEGGGRVGI